MFCLSGWLAVTAQPQPSSYPPRGLGRRRPGRVPTGSFFIDGPGCYGEPVNSPLSEPQRATLTDYFVARDLSAVNRLLAALPGPLGRVSIDAVDNRRAAEAAPVWRIEANGTTRFRFHEKSWDHHPAEIIGRWLDVLPLIEMVIVEAPVGSCVLNLGDEGHRPGLAFDGNADHFTLIPDHCFIKTDGYAGLAPRLFGSCAAMERTARRSFLARKYDRAGNAPVCLAAFSTLPRRTRLRGAGRCGLFPLFTAIRRR